MTDGKNSRVDNSLITGTVRSATVN